MSTPHRRLYLHIGLPKTGTTALQEILWRNRTALAQAGLWYPGHDSATQHRAAVDLLAERYHGWTDATTAGTWRWLVEQVAAAPTDVLLSSELLAPATHEQARTALDALSSVEVHIVCTARDLARQIPSVWQEDVKNRRTNEFAGFVQDVRSGREAEISALFWSYQDLPGVLRTWSQGIPPERVHVVTVPPRGSAPELLWQRFASVFGLDPAAFDTATSTPNSSLDLPQTELLRRLNMIIGETIPWPEYVRIVKGKFAEHVLPPLRGRTQIALPADAREWAVGAARQMVADVAAAGYDVTGDLADLVPLPDPKAPDAPATVTDTEVAEVALQALADLLRSEARPAGVRPGPAVKRFLLDLSEQHEQVMAMRRMYWRTKARLHHATDRVKRGG